MGRMSTWMQAFHVSQVHGFRGIRFFFCVSVLASDFPKVVFGEDLLPSSFALPAGESFISVQLRTCICAYGAHEYHGPQQLCPGVPSMPGKEKRSPFGLPAVDLAALLASASWACCRRLVSNRCLGTLFSFPYSVS